MSPAPTMPSGFTPSSPDARPAVLAAVRALRDDAGKASWDDVLERIGARYDSTENARAEAALESLLDSGVLIEGPIAMLRVVNE